jgi:hypothetical protein
LSPWITCPSDKGCRLAIVWGWWDEKCLQRSNEHEANMTGKPEINVRTHTFPAKCYFGRKYD